MDLLDNLVKFINDDEISNLDPLIKMALIHHQFESIHPFHDGNGRMGRILNILYLVQQKLLHTPILYLSSYIIEHKAEYYRLLRLVNESPSAASWETWCSWLIKGVDSTAKETLTRVRKIKKLMERTKEKFEKKSKIYTQDLINALFCFPYITPNSLIKTLKISRPTADTRFYELTKEGFLTKKDIGRNVYYFNEPLIEALK